MRTAIAGNAATPNAKDDEPSMKQLIEVMKQMQVEIASLKKRPGGKNQNRASSNGTGSNTGQTTAPTRTADGRPICFHCKGEGHIKRYCPTKKTEDEKQAATTIAMMSTADGEGNGEVPLLQIDVGQLLMERVMIGKEQPTTPTDAVIDTGAAVSIIAPALAEEMGLELKAWGGPSIVMVNGQRTPPLGRVQLKITIGEMTAKADVLVLEMRGIDLLLGNDVLRQLKKLEIEYGAGKPKMRFGELPVSMVVENKKETATKLVASNGTRIPAKSWAAVAVEQTEATRPTVDGRPWMIEPTGKRQTGPTPGRALMPGDRQTTWVMMLNMESRPVYIHKRTVLGHRTETDGEEVDVDDTEKEEVSDTWVLAADVEGGRPQKFDFDAQISQELPPHDRMSFRTTLEEFDGCFAKADDQLGRCNVTEHEIHLIPNARPIY